MRAGSAGPPGIGVVHPRPGVRLDVSGTDHASPVPKYFQPREVLLDLVETGLGVDQTIPSERELSQRYGLSRMCGPAGWFPARATWTGGPRRPACSWLGRWASSPATRCT